jgi:hypothetical protein
MCLHQRRPGDDLLKRYRPAADMLTDDLSDRAAVGPADRHAEAASHRHDLISVTDGAGFFR